MIDVQQREVVTIDVSKSGLESGVSKRTQRPGLTTTATMVQRALYFEEGKKATWEEQIVPRLNTNTKSVNLLME